MKAQSPTVPSAEEIKQRAHNLISPAEKQISLRHQWEDILEAGNLKQLLPEQLRQRALKAACALLEIESTKINCTLPSVQELADILQGNISESEQERREKRIVGQYVMFAICLFFALPCFAIGLITIGSLCLLAAACLLWVIHALRKGRPAWVIELFQDYFW